MWGDSSWIILRDTASNFSHILSVPRIIWRSTSWCLCLRSSTSIVQAPRPFEGPLASSTQRQLIVLQAYIPYMKLFLASADTDIEFDTQSAVEVPCTWPFSQWLRFYIHSFSTEFSMVRKAWPGLMTSPLRMQALRTVSARKKILQSLGRINLPVSPIRGRLGGITGSDLLALYCSR